jgi:tetratricopeptide (TPR) repeat protein
MGQALCQLGRFSEAISHLENACKQEGAGIQPQLLLADCLLVSDRLNDAADGYRRVLAADAGNLTARRKLSICQLKLGFADAALEHARYVLEHDRDDRTAAFNAAVAHLMLAQWSEARKVLDAALAIHKNDAALWALRAVIWRHRLRHAFRATVRRLPFVGGD